MKKFKHSKHCEYFITDSGIVFSRKNKTGILTKIALRSHKGYFTFKDSFVHQIVAKSFIDNPDNKRMVNHKDGNKKNNNVKNLEWSTAYENNNHAFSIGLNNSKKLSDAEVLKIIEEYNSGNYSSKDLSARWGVCDRMIMRYVKGLERKHLGITFTGKLKRPGAKPKHDEETVSAVKAMVKNGISRKHISEYTGKSKGAIAGILKK